MLNLRLMKYLVRAIKYFFKLLVILALILLAMIAFKFVEADITKMFVHGADSLWQIALLMAIFAAVYPRFGYVTRSIPVPGSPEETLPVLKRAMDARGYVLQKQDGESMVYVKRSKLDRILKMYEDTITVTPAITGYELEGAGKDVARAAAAIENAFNQI